MTAPRDWREMTHEELYAAVQSGPGAGASMAAEAMWRRLAEIIGAAEARMQAAVARSADGWQGEGADAARGGLGALNSWALDAATDAQTTLSAILDQGVSAGRLRASMPAPSTEPVAAARADVDANPGDADRAWALYDSEQQARDRDEDARRTMEQYHWLSAENSSTIDFWTAPPTVLVEVASAPPVGVPGLGPGGGVAGSPSATLPAGGPDASAGGGPVASGPGAQAAGPADRPVPAAGSAGPFGPGVAGAGPAGSGSAGARAGGAGAGGIGATAAGPAAAGPAAAGPAGAGSAGAGRVGARTVGPGSVGTGSAGAGGSGPRTVGSGPPSAGGSGPAPASGPPSGPVPTTGRVPPTGRDALPPGAGGRGPRIPTGGGVEAAPRAGGAFRPVLPGSPPPTGASPTWRDLVRGPGGALPGGPADPLTGNRTGGGGPGAAARPGLPTVTEPAARAGSGPAGSHGLYPPMGAAGGGQGEGRRRPSYLVDDSGAFDVDLPCTEPVIGESDPDADRRPDPHR